MSHPAALPSRRYLVSESPLMPHLTGSQGSIRVFFFATTSSLRLRQLPGSAPPDQEAVVSLWLLRSRLPPSPDAARSEPGCWPPAAGPNTGAKVQEQCCKLHEMSIEQGDRGRKLASANLLRLRRARELVQRKEAALLHRQQCGRGAEQCRSLPGGLVQHLVSWGLAGSHLQAPTVSSAAQAGCAGSCACIRA